MDPQWAAQLARSAGNNTSVSIVCPLHLFVSHENLRMHIVMLLLRLSLEQQRIQQLFNI